MAIGADEGEQMNRITCAACKYQRKRCRANCILRSHFPANMTDEFKAVQKVFGISNVTKMLREANTSQAQDTVVRSLIWEATAWDQDPLHGPYGCFMQQRAELEELKQYVQQLELLQGAALQTMHVPKKPLHAQDIVACYPGNMYMNMNYNSSSNSTMMGSDSGMPYAFNGVEAEIGQGLMGTQLQETRSGLINSNGGNGRQMYDYMTSHECVRNRLWSGNQVMPNSGSTVSAHDQFVGAERRQALRNGSYQATNGGLYINEAEYRQQCITMANYSRNPQGG